jgi:hypothetical protein
MQSSRTEQWVNEPDTRFVIHTIIDTIGGKRIKRAARVPIQISLTNGQLTSSKKRLTPYEIWQTEAGLPFLGAKIYRICSLCCLFQFPAFCPTALLSEQHGLF